MPNHIHGIVWIVEQLTNKQERYLNLDEADNGVCMGDLQVARTSNSDTSTEDISLQSTILSRSTKPKGPTSNSLGAIIAGFKSASTKKVNITRNALGQPVCLRNYYDHIIVTEKEYINISHYIHDNPENWETKDEYFF